MAGLAVLASPPGICRPGLCRSRIRRSRIWISSGSAHGGPQRCLRCRRSRRRGSGSLRLLRRRQQLLLQLLRRLGLPGSARILIGSARAWTAAWLRCLPPSPRERSVTWPVESLVVSIRWSVGNEGRGTGLSAKSACVRSRWAGRRFAGFHAHGAQVRPGNNSGKSPAKSQRESL